MAAAARDLLSGESSANVATARGFDTLSGFAKAFRKHYGLSPPEYQKELVDERFRIESEFRSLDSFTAVGYRLPPPQGEFNILTLALIGWEESFPSSARRITDDSVARPPQRLARGFIPIGIPANCFTSSDRSCRVLILSRMVWDC